jgi:hypothetical protein
MSTHYFKIQQATTGDFIAISVTHTADGTTVSFHRSGTSDVDAEEEITEFYVTGSHLFDYCTLEDCETIGRCPDFILFDVAKHINCDPSDLMYVPTRSE